MQPTTSDPSLLNPTSKHPLSSCDPGASNKAWASRITGPLEPEQVKQTRGYEGVVMNRSTDSYNFVWAHMHQCVRRLCLCSLAQLQHFVVGRQFDK
jgi:hypothetical protein